MKSETERNTKVFFSSHFFDEKFPFETEERIPSTFKRWEKRYFQTLREEILSNAERRDTFKRWEKRYFQTERSSQRNRQPGAVFTSNLFLHEMIFFRSGTK